jgi:uncharacterized membrane protein
VSSRIRCRARALLASLSLAGLVLLHTGCGSSHGGTPTGATCDTQLRYAEDVAPLLQRYCVSCHSSEVPLKQRHGAPGDHNFDSEEGVLEHAEHIDQSAGAGPDATNRSMPPAGIGATPSDAERALLASYVACQLPQDPPGEHVHVHAH